MGSSRECLREPQSNGIRSFIQAVIFSDKSSGLSHGNKNAGAADFHGSLSQRRGRRSRDGIAVSIEHTIVAGTKESLIAGLPVNLAAQVGAGCGKRSNIAAGLNKKKLLPSQVFSYNAPSFGNIGDGRNKHLNFSGRTLSSEKIPESVNRRCTITNRQPGNHA